MPFVKAQCTNCGGVLQADLSNGKAIYRKRQGATKAEVKSK